MEMYSKVLGTSLIVPLKSLTSEHYDLRRLHEYIGNDETVLEICNYLLFQYYLGELNGNKLVKFKEIVMNYGAKDLSDIVSFAITRLLALNHYKLNDFTTVIQLLNPIISSCPRSKGIYLPGLADTLILLAESYGALGRYDDAVQSAKLAVTIAHERLEYTQLLQKYNYNNGSNTNSSNNLKPYGNTSLNSSLNPALTNSITSSLSSSRIQHICGPMLDSLAAVVVAYHTIANHIENIPALYSLSMDWHDRALQTAIRFNLDMRYLSIYFLYCCNELTSLIY